MDLKRRLQMYLVFLLMLTVIQACGSNSTATPLPTLPITTATVTRPPTNPPRPTESTPPTPDDVATLHAVETASIQTLTSTVQPEVLEEIPSPDGNWQVDVIRYDCINVTYQDYRAIIAYEQLKIIDLNDRAEVIVDDQRQTCDGIGMAGFDGLYWSPNNRYFYYTDSREGYPETCSYYTVLPVYRLDTSNKEVILVGGAHFSPDKTKLAMWQWQGNEIVIWDLDKGEIGRIQGLVPNLVNGQISWSRDSQSLVYLQTTFDCAPDYGKTYLIRLNLSESSQELLLEHDSPGFGSVSWDTTNQLSLKDGLGNIWTYNLVSKELKAAP